MRKEEILAAHFQATRKRFFSQDGPILVLQGTPEFFSRHNDEAIAMLGWMCESLSALLSLPDAANVARDWNSSSTAGSRQQSGPSAIPKHR